VGEYYTVEQLSGMMLRLQEKGAHNINFVTPNHFVPQICAAIFRARAKGLEIPIVYNTSGYDSMRCLKLIDGLIDIYLVDMRYSNAKWSNQYSAAEDYVSVNRAALREMYRQVGDLVLNHGIAERGIIVRHLVLPENVSGTESIFQFLSKEISNKTYISLMDQYFPCFRVLKDPVLSRRITGEEYEHARELMESYGLHRGWVQEHLL
jgi:putative pyruvate formate lyase activating enzyme